MMVASTENAVMHLYPHYGIIRDEVMDQSYGECSSEENLLHLQDLSII